MKIYFAAPLFTAAEIMWNSSVTKVLRKIGYKVFLPQEAQPKNAQSAFDSDLYNIDSADVITAVLDGADPDSGTCWEFGYAYAKNKLLIAIRTDLRTGNDAGEPFNLMLSRSKDALVTIQFGSPRDVAVSIDACIKGLEKTI